MNYNTSLIINGHDRMKDIAGYAKKLEKYFKKAMV